MIQGAFSNRIYKDKLHNEELENMSNILVLCNDAKINLYSDIIHSKINEKEVNTTYVINKYGLNTYYANMVIRKTKETLKSGKELIPYYIQKQERLIEKQQTKIEKTIRQIAFYRKVKEVCVFYSDEIVKNGVSYVPNMVLQTIFPYTFETNENGEIIVIMCCNNKNNKNGKNSKKNKGNFSKFLQNFENDINLKIVRLKHKLYLLTNKLNRYHQVKENLSNIPYITCFGTKKLFKAQYTIDTYKNNHELWKKEWQHKRHNTFVVSGSKNHEGGSMCARYDFENNRLFFMKPIQGKIEDGKTYAKQSSFSIPCNFLYKEEEYKLAYENQVTIAYQIFDKGNYFIIMASFDLQELKEKLKEKEQYFPSSNNNELLETKENRINDYIENGIVALDINVDNFTLVDMDKNGNYLGSKIFRFDLSHLTSNQATKKLELLALELFAYCKERKKPLVRENISNIKFKDTKDKNTNRKLSSFAYNKMLNTIDRCFYKNDYKIFTINPVYTSQIGKIKYMRRLGLSIHQSAAFCIGRRFLFTKGNKNENKNNRNSSFNLYYEDIGKYKRFGNIKKVSKELKRLRIHDFYTIEKEDFPIHLEDYTSKQLKKYVSDVKQYLKQTKVS